jgi:hypothetical protein
VGVPRNHQTIPQKTFRLTRPNLERMSQYDLVWSKLYGGISKRTRGLVNRDSVQSWKSSATNVDRINFQPKKFAIDDDELDSTATTTCTTPEDLPSPVSSSSKRKHSFNTLDFISSPMSAKIIDDEEFEDAQQQKKTSIKSRSTGSLTLKKLLPAYSSKNLAGETKVKSSSMGPVDYKKHNYTSKARSFNQSALNLSTIADEV